MPNTPPDVPYLRPEKTGAVIVDLHVSPNPSHTAIQGLHDGALALRIQAVPVDGKANAAIVAWLAKSLGVSRSHIELLRDTTSKRKQFRISTEGVNQADWSSLVP